MEEQDKELLSKLNTLFGWNGFDLPWDKPRSVKCPLHSDNNNSGSILLISNTEKRFEGGGYFNCFAGCGKFTLPNLIKRLEETNQFPNPEAYQPEENLWKGWIEDSGDTKNKEVKKPKIKLSNSQEVEQYSDFLFSKGFTTEEIANLGGTLVTDFESPYYGYLTFTYGRGNKHTVGRKIFSIEGDRFKNSSGNKGLLGHNELDKNVKEVILLEGLTDYLQARKAGLKNIVCSLGAQLSKEQAYLLRKWTVFILYDPDFAGYEGAKTGCKTLKDYGTTAIALEIPDQFTENQKEKADVCFLLSGDSKTIFLDWLSSTISNYSTYDNNYIKKNFKKAPKLKYYRTGIKEFDSLLGGGLVQGLHVFGGMPKIGKSTFCVELACNLLEQGARVLYCTYELSKDQIWSRIAARDSEFSWQEIESNNSILDDRNWRLLEIRSEKLKVVNNFSLPEIRATLTSFDVYIIDYLQRMKSKQPGEMEKIKENIEGLAELVQQDKKIFILITEMSRAQYERTNDLGIAKGSGEVEYCAQSLSKLSKIGNTENPILEIDLLANTRGTTQKVYTRINYPHQKLTETRLEDVYKGVK